MRAESVGYLHAQGKRLIPFLVPVVLAIALLQLYFVREAFAAELLFAVAFCSLAALTAAGWLLGIVCQYAWKWIEPRAQWLIDHSARLYADLRLAYSHSHSAGLLPH
jgi:hypothetical protein